VDPPLLPLATTILATTILATTILATTILHNKKKKNLKKKGGNPKEGSRLGLPGAKGDRKVGSEERGVPILM
jgi:hypothetical protein